MSEYLGIGINKSPQASPLDVFVNQIIDSKDKNSGSLSDPLFFSNF